MTQLSPALVLALVLLGTTLLLLILWRRSAAGEAPLREALSRAEAAAQREAEAGAAREAQLAELREQREAQGLRASLAEARAEDLSRQLADRTAEREAAHAQLAEQRAEAAAQALRARQAETRTEALEGQLSERTGERDRAREAQGTEQRRAEGLVRELAEARLAARKDAEASAREIATLRELRKEMTDQFRLLADETLKSTGADFQTRHAEQLSALLTPFREQVERFQTELVNRETAAGQERARLSQQIETLHNRSEAISQEAVALTRALKGDKQAQGAWGEMVLLSLLEDSGLVRDTHFTVHETRHAEDGRRLHPDVVVRLPNGRRVIVDSKVSLIDYEAACNAETPAERDTALTRHARALRNHATGLSGKDYAGLDAESVDYVVMFVPIESAYYDAMRHDRELWRHAQDRRVIIAPPMNLLALLRTIEHIWAVEKRETNAANIAHRAGQLYDKLAGFVDTMEEAGKALGRAMDAHQKAMGQLSRGRGNALRQAEQLRALGAKTNKQIALDHDAEDAAPLQLEAAE